MRSLRKGILETGGDQRRPEEEAVSLVRHCSTLSKTQPGDGGIGHRGGHWCS